MTDAHLDTVRAPQRTAKHPYSLLRALRPKQWSKNVLVFAAPLAAGTLLELETLAGTMWAFVSFCLASSSTYLINDIRDVESDRAHPTKKNRPIASGAVKPRTAILLAVGLVVTALGVAFWQNPALGWTVLAYLVATLLYSLGLKHEPVLELVLLSMGFLLRAIAGATATDTPLSQWFLLVAGFGSLFMAAGKRYSELLRVRALDSNGKSHGVGRKVLESYTSEYLRFVVAVAAGVASVAYCLWAFDVGADQSPPWSLMSALPFFIALLRYAADIFRGTAEAPEDAVFADRILLGAGLAWVIVFGLGVFAS
jgi:decaprenyl-phosphate phosphoribosyltransferase